MIGDTLIRCCYFVAPLQFMPCTSTCDEGVMEARSCDNISCSVIQEGCNLRPCDGESLCNI